MGRKIRLLWRDAGPVSGRPVLVVLEHKKGRLHIAEIDNPLRSIPYTAYAGTRHIRPEFREALVDCRNDIRIGKKI